MRCLVITLPLIIDSDVEQRLGPVRHGLVGGDVALDYFRPRLRLELLDLSDLIQCDPHLIVATAHLDSTPVVAQRGIEVPYQEIRLGEIKDVASVVRLVAKHPFKRLDVVKEGLRVSGASAVAVRSQPQTGKELLATGLVTTGVLMEDALIAPR